jgi:vacuolar iron transporter family protein
MNESNKLMNDNTRQGIFFGINSGVLTTVGVIAGISQTTTNPMYVIISVLSLAISDCIGEAYGMYISKKAEQVTQNDNGPLYSLVSVFLAKFITVILFLVPLIFYWNLKYYKNLLWPMLYSLFVLIYIDNRLAEMRKESKTKYIVTHMVLLFIVVISTKYIGQALGNYKK